MGDRLSNKDILRAIMTQHWDLCACACWVCVAARANGIRPREDFLRHKDARGRSPRVTVERGEYPAPVSPSTEETE